MTNYSTKKLSTWETVTTRETLKLLIKVSQNYEENFLAHGQRKSIAFFISIDFNDD